MARLQKTNSLCRFLGLLVPSALIFGGCIGTAEFTDYSTEFDQLSEKTVLLWHQ
jgi:hypothetical protein